MEASAGILEHPSAGSGREEMPVTASTASRFDTRLALSWEMYMSLLSTAAIDGTKRR